MRGDDARALRMLLETSGTGYWHVAIDGTTIYANPAVCELFEDPGHERRAKRPRR